MKARPHASHHGQVFRRDNLSFCGATIMQDRTTTAGETGAGSGAEARGLTLGPGEGEAIWFLTNRITIKARARATGGAYGLFEAELPAGFSPPLHVHHREDEAFWILEGEFSVRCGDRTFPAGPGSFV